MDLRLVWLRLLKLLNRRMNRMMMMMGGRYAGEGEGCGGYRRHHGARGKGVVVGQRRGRRLLLLSRHRRQPRGRGGYSGREGRGQRREHRGVMM